MRRTVGVFLLAISVVDSLLWLSGWFHPIALRWRAQGGLEHTIVIVLSSLTFKALLLFSGAVLAFWPKKLKS
jgi:hypothetical protein